MDGGKKLPDRAILSHRELSANTLKAALGVPVCFLPLFLASFFLCCLEATLRDLRESNETKDKLEASRLIGV